MNQKLNLKNTDFEVSIFFLTYRLTYFDQRGIIILVVKDKWLIMNHQEALKGTLTNLIGLSNQANLKEELK